MALRLPYKKRIDVIKDRLPEGDQWKEIAKRCGVHRATIHRDFKRWSQSDDFKIWIYEQYMRLHGKVSKNKPEVALNYLSRLLVKTMTEKLEHKGDINIRIEMDGLGKRPTDKT